MKKKNNTFAIIGLGRFGMAVAKTLLSEKREVIAIDIDMNKLKLLSDTDATLCHVEEITVDTLREAGVADADVAIIGIGRDLESNILASMDSLELGVRTVISKASNDEHARILTKLGAVAVYPEVETAKRLAIKLSKDLTEDVVPLSEDFFIMQSPIPKSWDGKTVLSVDLRKKFDINIIALIHAGKANATIRPETMLKAGDGMVICGTSRNIEALQQELKNAELT